MLRVEFHFGRLYGLDADRQRDKVHGLLKELITERLHPDTLEALMCAQNWIWAPLRGHIPEEEVYATEGVDDEEPVAPS
ncbi:hypothetical protein Q3G72_003170 [Acer saccharum]|nr:hypothetical protein Q3G72_003170 [Acer saccharum]